ncbi:ABC transporter permease [Chthonobacter albigriseus]|uniref:ABC transporter permease n=1 Tax=Chthonobacter albigriseus TaxID=1683161 RepID=UPI0015EE82FA|nr:ABC transporter permease [Chthonobacter albigriseus]
MNAATVRWILMGYVLLVFLFILAPILTLVAFSFNVDRFPALPWGGFSLAWYEAVFADETVSTGFRNTMIVAVTTAVVATFIGFATAYVDYRYQFTGKRAYLALASLPPTVPVVILGIANLSFMAAIGLSGTLTAVILGHVVIAAPYAMALIRIRLADLDPAIEPAAWNLGATPWATMGQVIVPFCKPAILSSLAITAAVSFDEFMIAWFVSGIHETLPVRILAMLQGQVSPRINAVGSLVFLVTVALVVVAQIAVFSWRRKRPLAGGGDG